MAGIGASTKPQAMRCHAAPMTLARILALFLLFAPPALADACQWREPARTYPDGVSWRCNAIRWADGDTLTARCRGQAEPVRVRLRGVDTVERGKVGWSAARLELRRRTQAVRLVILPHHGSHDRVVATVLVRGRDVGRAMDAAGWSKVGCPRR